MLKSEVKAVVKRELYLTLLLKAQQMMSSETGNYEAEQILVQLNRCIRTLGFEEFVCYNRDKKQFE